MEHSTFPGESPAVNRQESYQFNKGAAANYSVTAADGTLTMTNASAAITITAASQGWVYSGQLMPGGCPDRGGTGQRQACIGHSEWE